MTCLEQWQSARDDFRHLGRIVDSLIVARDIEGAPDFTEDETFVMAWLEARRLCILRANAAYPGAMAELAARSRRSWWTRLRAWARWFWFG